MRREALTWCTEVAGFACVQATEECRNVCHVVRLKRNKEVLESLLDSKHLLQVRVDYSPYDKFSAEFRENNDAIHPEIDKGRKLRNVAG